MTAVSLHAYLDESGNSNMDLTNDGASTHFAVGAIIIDMQNVSAVENHVEQIAIKHFSGGELKSSNIGNKDQRRLQILELLMAAPITVFGLIVDKRKLYSDGFAYKKSFIKFLNNVAYRSLFNAFPSIKLVPDEHGTKEFMQGFKEYVEKKNPQTLFRQSEFEFAESRSSRLNQFADVVTGSLWKCFDDRSRSKKSVDILELLKRDDKLLPVVEWPRNYPQIIDEHNSEDFGPFDKEIFHQSIAMARQYIADNQHKPEERARTLCARLLVNNATYGSPKEYLSTRELIAAMRQYPDTSVTAKPFGRVIIGKLRDAGLLITSNTRGYKLVVNQTDLDGLVGYYSHFIGPMLGRLNRARASILTSTRNQLDIFNAPEHAYLKRIADPM